MQKRLLSVERLEEIARNAILGGYGHIDTWSDHVRDPAGKPVKADPLGGRLRRLVVLRCSMDCLDPVHVELFARDSVRHGRAVKPMTVVVYSRCRKCGSCRSRRAMFWRGRAFSEYGASVRTFFGTLTIAPENDALLDALARIELGEKGTDFDTLTDAERFRVRCTVGGREITKYLKRIREGEKDRSYREAFRYLFIAEPHQSDASSSMKKGRPHWHCLIHETDFARPLVLPHEFAVNAKGEPITDKYGNAFLSDTALLKRQWKMGYSRFMLCQTPTAATYTTKYLTKEDTQVRIRASGNYGNSGNSDVVAIA